MTINRNYDILFDAQSVSGAIDTLDDLVEGADYVDGTYEDVPLTGGSGSGATADIIVLLGVITTVTPVLAGTGYQVGDVLSANVEDLGGEGSGFEIVVATLSGSANDFISAAFRCDNVKSEYRKPQLFAFGSLDSGTIKIQALRPDKNLSTADNSISSADWVDLDITITLGELIDLKYSTLEHRLVITNIGAAGDLTAFIVYNAE